MRWFICLLLLGVAGATTPLPPPSITVPVGYTATLTWKAVTTYVDGSPITKTPSYKLYSMKPSLPPGFLGYQGNVLSIKKTFPNAGTFCYAVSVAVWDPSMNESALSTPVCLLVQ